MKTLVGVSLVLVLSFSPVHARYTGRSAVRPMRPVLEGGFGGDDILTIDQGIRDRFTAAQAETFCIVRYDFEEMDWQGWTRDGSPYSGLAAGLADKDPCNHNLSTQVVFFIGSTYPSTEYPGLYDTPFCEGPGGIGPPCQEEQIVSPVIDITRYSANCDEIQDAAIPPGVLPDLGGARLAFTVYADLPIVNLVFYRWAVRNITDGCPGPWLDRNYLYYSDDPVYRFVVEEIGDLLTADSVQVALGIVDMCPYWYGIYGDCAEHTPAPWFDNVSIRRYATIGPQWSCRPIDLFQDNFPGSEDIESWVRADMAADINPGGDPVIRPGDSIVVDCASPTGGGIAEDGNGPRVYMHVRCAYIGNVMYPKPSLAGPELEGTYGRYVSDDGTWTVIQGDTAVSHAGVPVPGRYMFDLNDSLLTRGYMIEYYFKAYDNDGNSTTLPADAESAPPHHMPTASHLFEFTCLPLINSRMLYVDDYDGIGCRDGIAQVYFDRIILAMDHYLNKEWYCIPDRYDINGPTSLVSNGLAGRARLSHLLDGYGAIIWDSGDLASGTITDGSIDKCDDCSLLAEWLDSLQRDLYGIWILGTDVAGDLSGLGSPQALALMGDWCGVTSEHGSYFGLTGGYDGGGVVNPKVTAVPYDPSYINPFWHTTWGDSIYAFGGCPGIRSFDVLGATANGIPVLTYPEFGGEERYAAIAATDTNSLGFEVKTMWFGFSFMHMRDCWEVHPAPPIMSTYMYREVMRGHINIGCSPSDITHNDDVPTVDALLQNHPNPFNPATTIRFSLARLGHASLVIYDVTGRRVRTLVDGSREAGAHAVMWDGTNDRGADIASGVYFYRLTAAGFEETRKMVLLR